MRHACPATRPDKNSWAEFYYDFVTGEQIIAGETMKSDPEQCGEIRSQYDVAAVYRTGQSSPLYRLA
jgi:hypothetical protein